MSLRTQFERERQREREYEALDRVRRRTELVSTNVHFFETSDKKAARKQALLEGQLAEQAAIEARHNALLARRAGLRTLYLHDIHEYRSQLLAMNADLSQGIEQLWLCEEPDAKLAV